MYIILPLQAYGYAPAQRVFQNIYLIWSILILLHCLVTRSFKFDRILIVLALFFLVGLYYVSGSAQSTWYYPGETSSDTADYERSSFSSFEIL